MKMAQTLILDYECVGSRVWPVLAVITVPNLLILFKIISN